MIYQPEDSHPSRYKPGPTWVNFVHATNYANHYATPPTSEVNWPITKTHRRILTVE